MNKDKIIKFLAYDGRVNVICADTTNLVEKIRKIHDLSPVVTAALGRVVTITALMGCQMKNETDKLTVQIKGNGPIDSIVAVSDSKAQIKCYAANPIVDLPLNEDGKLDVGKAVGNEGYINIIKDIGMKEPYTGMVPIVSGEIAEDFANYFKVSEQQQTAVALGVLVDKNGVKSSGGYIINLMPDATNEDIFNLEKAIFNAGAISKMLDRKLGLEEIAKKITNDENIKIIENEIVPEYYCNCSKEKIEKGIITLGKEELEKIFKEQKKIETVCHFCNKKYVFDKNDIKY